MSQRYCLFACWPKTWLTSVSHGKPIGQKTLHIQMFLFCFASRQQNHKAFRSTEVCWTLILKTLSHRVKMKYMRAWIIYIALHYIAPWHANVKNWIVSTISSPVHRLDIALGAAVCFFCSISQPPLRQATSWGKNSKKYPVCSGAKAGSVPAGPRHPGCAVQPPVAPRLALRRQVDWLLSWLRPHIPQAAAKSSTNSRAEGFRKKCETMGRRGSTSLLLLVSVIRFLLTRSMSCSSSQLSLWPLLIPCSHRYSQLAGKVDFRGKQR